MSGTVSSCRTARRRRSSRNSIRGINAALRDPNVLGRFEQLNIETRPTTPQEFGSFVDEQMARWSKVVKEANIRLG